MTAVNLGEFIERVLPLELAMGDMFRRLADRLGPFPALASLLKDLEIEERTHFRLICGFRDSLLPAHLTHPCDENTVRQLARVEAMLDGDPLEPFTDFQEAFEFIHELENCEVAPMIRLLHQECPERGIDCSGLTAIVEPHLALLERLAETAGDRLRRRAIRI